MNAARVQRIKIEAVPLLSVDGLMSQMAGDAFMDDLQKALVDALASFAITGSVAGGNRQLMAGIPALNHAQGMLTGAIGMKNLAEPSPECG